MALPHCSGPLPSAYSPEEIEQYLDHISLPRYLLEQERDIELLSILHALQIVAVPYENLSLHYNPDHRNKIDPQALFKKFVTNKRGRGGYCMETAIFWREILRGLGFHTYTAAARIRLRTDGVPSGDFVGYRHVTNIVTLPTGKYSSDVGFGGDGATSPLPLAANHIIRNLGTQQIRLIHAPFPGALYPEHNMTWQYQYRNLPSLPWNIYYAFSEQEAFDADFTILNYYTSVSPDSFQVQSQLAVKFVLSPMGKALAQGKKDYQSDSESDGKGSGDKENSELYEGTGGSGLILGKVMLAGNVVKRNLGGKTETLLVCNTEKERVDALKEYFGLTLTKEEETGIRGFVTELK